MKHSERNAQDREMLLRSVAMIATMTVPLSSPECPFVIERRQSPGGGSWDEVVKPRRPIPPSLQMLLASVHDSGGYYWIANFETSPGNVEITAWPSREGWNRAGSGRP